MMNFGEYLLREYDPRFVKKYTEKPSPGLSSRKPAATTGKGSATKHTGPMAATPSSDPTLQKLRTSRFAGAAASSKNRAALRKRSAILAKRRPVKKR